MTARPILFSAPMVRALLEGRKTQTRRVMKPQPVDHVELWRADGHGTWYGSDRVKSSGGLGVPVTGMINCPFGQPGDLLWVRETWSYHPDTESGPVVSYLASGHGGQPHWRPSIHMPRWASRLTLRITDVRVQRAQDISEEDCIAEGLLRVTGDGLGPGAGCKWVGDGFHGGQNARSGSPLFHTPSLDGACRCAAHGPSAAQCAFADLWDSLHRDDESFFANPWVWAITFEVLRANVDAVLENRETQA